MIGNTIVRDSKRSADSYLDQNQTSRLVQSVLIFGTEGL